MRKYVIIFVLFSMMIVNSVTAQTPSAVTDYSAEKAAINKVIDKYNQTEDDCDFIAQAKLMSTDRIFVGAAGEGRTVNQKDNMKMQKVKLDIEKKEVPGIVWFTDARDRIIRVYGNGTVAVASFYWLRAVYLPANTPPEIASRYPQPHQHSVSLVLEKKNDEWKIVHTHMSLLYPVGGH